MISVMISVVYSSSLSSTKLKKELVNRKIAYFERISLDLCIMLCFSDTRAFRS